jgi:integrase/recombinase XerC
MSELSAQIAAYLDELRRSGASPHTLRAYESDLSQFREYFSPPAEPAESEPPAPAEFDVLKIREWLAGLYDLKLDRISMRRKLAALRSFFRYLVRQGIIPTNPARLVLTPKASKKLPVVMTAEQANALVDAPPSDTVPAAWPARDRAILEFLYGCGLRASELVGMNLEDIDFSQHWVRVRGKGRKERQVPFGAKAADSLDRYLPERSAQANPKESAVFLNRRGHRITTRGVQGIVKLYATLVAGDSSIHPHSFRHAYATHLLGDGADLRAVQELLGHARLSTTQKYTQLSLTDLMAVYDRAHPKA